tara:strand:+ start:6140 stop:7357 length:1218 start_codon:yes stop_codon:yes gene_type:complete
MISALTFPALIPMLAKEIFFLAPAYGGFIYFITHNKLVKPPPQLWIPISVSCSIVLVQLFNPNLDNILLAVIGLKVWLFYIPVAFLSFYMFRTEIELIKFLRVMLLITPIPCVVGIIQYIGGLTFGYQEFMTAIYGAETAFNVTQGFTDFSADVGALYVRIPGTFSFITPYTGYLLAMVPVSYILWKIDPSPSWRTFAKVVLLLLVVSATLSGSRGTSIFMALFFVILFCLQGQFFTLLKVILLLLGLGSLLLLSVDISLVSMFGLLVTLIPHYLDTIVLGGLLEAFSKTLFGLGLGTNTGAARYAMENQGAIFAIENYYAKSYIELGLLGLLMTIFIFLSPLHYYIKNKKLCNNPKVKIVTSSFVAFILLIAIHSFKGWQIDLDPINFYFWFYYGLLFRTYTLF